MHWCRCCRFCPFCRTQREGPGWDTAPESADPLSSPCLSVTFFVLQQTGFPPSLASECISGFLSPSPFPHPLEAGLLSGLRAGRPRPLGKWTRLWDRNPRMLFPLSLLPFSQGFRMPSFPACSALPGPFSRPESWPTNLWATLPCACFTLQGWATWVLCSLYSSKEESPLSTFETFLHIGFPGPQRHDCSEA